ncbi:tyrosine-type recombinase/integrase [Nitrobacteraceae bacterium UC4449_H16]
MLKLTERHGSSYYYLRGTVRGISIDESTGIARGNKKAAEEYKVIREREVLEESIHGKRAVATFSQAALSYIENGGSKRFLEPILKHFGTTKLAKIGQAEIDKCARTIYPTQSLSTLNRQAYTPISAVIKHAARRGWCTFFKIERPVYDDTHVRWINSDEANTLIEKCSLALRPLVIFLLYTGARCGEALWLEWKDVDLERRHVQFIDTKNGTSRGVPLHQRAVEALTKAKGNHPLYVFTKATGEPYRMLDDEKPADISAGDRIKNGFAGACKRAGLVDFTPHDCRHTWATWHYQANRDLGALQRLGGWKTLSMVLRYAHTNVAELDQTIDRIK